MNTTVLACVFLGGGVGSVVRFVIGKFTTSVWGNYPYGTLIANLLGAILVGVFSVWIFERRLISAPFNDLLLAGFLGGLTTFSSMVLDTYKLAEREPLWVAMVYLFSNLVVGFLLFFVAQSLVRRA